MREINLGTKSNVLHPCEVEYLKHDILRDKYYLYFFDRVLNDYCFAEVIIGDDDKYYVKEIDYRSFEGFFHALSSLAMPKMDITELPPVMPYYKKTKKNQTNLLLGKRNGSSGVIIKRVEYLELESYANALKDGPEYLYFIVNDMRPLLNSFEYNLTFACKSDEPLKKNIIARHKTDKSLADFPSDGNVYGIRFPYEEKLNVNHKLERPLVRKIMDLEKNRRKNMDPVLVTKIVRMILAREDYVQAAREYQIYLRDYYDKWVKEEEYKHL